MTAGHRRALPAGGRRAGKRLLAWLGLALLCALVNRPALPAQSSSDSSGGQTSAHPLRQSFEALPPEYGDPIAAERRQRALDIERQKQMVADAGKLLKLAKELNDEIAAANTGTLTPGQLRKIAEIEKLARSVKDRMTLGTGSSQPSTMFPSQAPAGASLFDFPYPR